MVDNDHSGPAAGTEEVVILFRNISPAACWLGGVPTLAGITASGSIVRLIFHGSSDPTYADPGPATGPGPLPASALGALHLTASLNNCSEPKPRYLYLQINLEGGQKVRTPYPPELALTGCFGAVAEAGPIPPAA